MEPVISLTPAALNYGNVAVGSPSVLVLAVQNTGTADLVVTNITSNDGQFVPALTSFTVTAGNTQNVNVTFTPSSAGAQAGTLTITHNAAGSPSAVAMTGTGVLLPVIGVSPATLDFGNVDLLTADILALTVSNTGPVDLVVTNITSTDGQFVPSTTSFTVSSGNNQVVNITFTPTIPGTQAGTLNITHNGAGSPTAVPMTGDATVIVGSTTINFGVVPLGSSAVRSLSVDNPSGVLVNVTSVSADGADFSSDQSAFAIAPVGSQTLNLTFTPTVAGPQTATLSITHNPTVTVTLVGATPTGSSGGRYPGDRGRLKPFEIPFGHQYLATLLFGILSWYALKRKT